MTWNSDINEAPRDGTPILVYCESGEYPFVVWWGHPGRYYSTTVPYYWLGHEDGLHEDKEILGWQYLPRTE